MGEFLVLPKLTNNIPLMYIDTSNMNVPKNIQLADPQHYKPQKIDIILGASVFFEVLGIDRIQPVKNGVFFQETHFGYIISGQVPSAKNNPSTSIMSFVACTDMLRLEDPKIGRKSFKILAIGRDLASKVVFARRKIMSTAL